MIRNDGPPGDDMMAFPTNDTGASSQMMLDYLGEREKAEKIERALTQVIAEGSIRTYDMGGTATTTQMAEAISSAIS